jgi:HlyD family secretion protein
MSTTISATEIDPGSTLDAAGPAEVGSPKVSPPDHTAMPRPKTREGWRSRVQRRRLLWLAILAAAAAALALLLRPTPLEVEVAQVGLGPLETTVDSDGITRVVDRFRIAAPVSGRLVRIQLREGDMLAVGDEVARISPAPLDTRSDEQARARVTQARALMQEAEARVEQTGAAQRQAERTTARFREIAAAGALSVDAIERHELEAVTALREHQAAMSRARAAAADLRVAQAALLDGSTTRESVLLRSPAAGQILRVHEPSERVVVAGTPLVDVGDADRLEVVADVLSTEAVRIAPGAPARVVDWGGEGVLQGTVRRVEAVAFTKISALGVEEQRVNVIVDVASPPAMLGDGFRVGVRVVTWTAPEVLRVPTGALFRSEGEWAVFVIEQGRARLRPVQIGHRGAGDAEVLDGLGAGDSVILFPSDQVRDGMRVRGR